MPARAVHCCVTSPPYWGLRDYGTGTWEGGSADCDHQKPSIAGLMDTSTLANRATNQNHDKEPWRGGVCGRCGARRVDMQIGNEPSPDCGTRGQAQCGGCFVCSMVSVFREVYRVLRDDGTLWLNLGDTFVDGGQGMIPARVAMALREDGWILKQDIIWYSPNKLPEPVMGRCVKSHEHIFILTKSADYYFDYVAIQVEGKSKPHAPGNKKLKDDNGVSSLRNDTDELSSTTNVWAANGNVNKRDVWVVPTVGYPGTHFAVYSPRLITPCILAGTSEHGCCADCGKPYKRVVVKTGGQPAEPNNDRDRSIPSNRNGNTGSLDGVFAKRETVGWRRACGCRTDVVEPCVVLDPFVGSGTTVATALELGRHGVGIDLSEKYLRQNAIPRIEASLGKVRTGSTVVLPDAVAAAPVRLRGA